MRPARVQEQFGDHLRTERITAGLTQTGVAQMMVDRGFKWIQTTVTKTEKGRRPMSLDEYVALCDMLGIDASGWLTLHAGDLTSRI